MSVDLNQNKMDRSVMRHDMLVDLNQNIKGSCHCCTLVYIDIFIFSPEYNPLMGGGSSGACYRPSRRGATGGG